MVEALSEEPQGEQREWQRTSYRLRKAKCKFKLDLALVRKTSADTAVRWSLSFVAVPCLINRTNAFPTPSFFFFFTPQTQGSMCVDEYEQAVLIIYVPVHQRVIVGSGPWASWNSLGHLVGKTGICFCVSWVLALLPLTTLSSAVEAVGPSCLDAAVSHRPLPSLIHPIGCIRGQAYCIRMLVAASNLKIQLTASTVWRCVFFPRKSRQGGFRHQQGLGSPPSFALLSSA